MPTIKRVNNENNLALFNLIKSEVGKALSSLRKGEVDIERYNDIVFNLSSFSIQMQIEFQNKNKFVSKEKLMERLKDFQKAKNKI